MKDEIIGLARGIVELIPHQAIWCELFNKESEQIKLAIGEQEIEHIGSTAVSGILAKPIIDIAVPYHDEIQGSTWITSLKSIGYQYKGEQGVPGRIFFVKGPEERRAFYLHAVDQNEFKRMITFRDRLRGR